MYARLNTILVYLSFIYYSQPYFYARYGMTVKAKLDSLGGGYAKVRLPFPREVTERKVVKEVIVEMTRASSGSN